MRYKVEFAVAALADSEVIMFDSHDDAIDFIESYVQKIVDNERNHYAPEGISEEYENEIREQEMSLILFTQESD
jgi:predicted phosphoribosyltransferase|tara:strand:- start:633 stop:854 length:222 start_codon:yes stop_codon:yes gene_type:complete